MSMSKLVIFRKQTSKSLRKLEVHFLSFTYVVLLFIVMF